MVFVGAGDYLKIPVYQTLRMPYVVRDSFIEGSWLIYIEFVSAGDCLENPVYQRWCGKYHGHLRQVEHLTAQLALQHTATHCNTLQHMLLYSLRKITVKLTFKNDIYVYVHTYACMYEGEFIHIWIYVYIYIHISICKYVYTYVKIHMCMYMYICMYIYIDIYIYIFISIHIYIFVYV